MAWFEDPAVQAWEQTQITNTDKNPYYFVSRLWEHSDALGIILTANLAKWKFPIEIAPEACQSWYQELLARKESFEKDQAFQTMIAGRVKPHPYEAYWQQKRIQEAREHQDAFLEHAFFLCGRMRFFSFAARKARKILFQAWLAKKFGPPGGIPEKIRPSGRHSWG